MEQEKQAQVARFGMAASIATAFAASICCIGPIVAVMFGMTTLAALSKYEPLRPIFGAATAAFLSVAFYLTYRKPAAECAPGSLCETGGVDRMQKIQRVTLWVATVAALIVFTFPTWSAWVLR